jgi:CDP-diacylglycerol--serine O-phosphatidyltransferase
MLDNELDTKGTKGKKRVRRGVYLLPNLLTSASLFGGFYSIVASFDGRYEVAAVAILVSAVFDCVDGRIARLTGTTSKFGMEYDSLSDLISFGLAPGVLIFTWALRPFGRYGWLAAFLYVVCSALRLARFNGLPVPVAAVTVASTVLLLFYLGQGATARHITVLALVYLLALLMVSNVKFYSFKELSLSKRMPFRLLVGVIFVFIVIAAEPQAMLFTLSFGYIVSGPVTMFIERRRKLARKAAAEEEKLGDAPRKSG